MLDSGDYFGSSVASIGDLYADGAGDSAAGAYLDCRSGWNQGPNLTHVARRIRLDYFLEWIAIPAISARLPRCPRSRAPKTNFRTVLSTC